ncbi:unnamed protein product [Gadus morhua 'NCC']
MYVVLKRQSFSKNRKSRSADIHINEGLCLYITLKHAHHHLLMCAEAMRKRWVTHTSLQLLIAPFVQI